RNRCGCVLRVNAQTGLLDGGRAHVRAKYLYRVVPVVALQIFGQADGDGVNLLASRAARNPDSDRLLSGPPLLEERGKGGFLESVKDRRIAEELRHVNQQVVEQCV